MNINQIFAKKEQESVYVSSFRRGSATMIDMLIVLFIRTFAMQFMAIMWINNQMAQFQYEFQQQFGTESMKNTPEHINYFLHHRIFIYALLFYGITLLVGAFYHAYFNSSKWQATVGKRVMKIIMINEANSDQISFKKAISHYFLSILPFIYILYLISYQVYHNLSFFHTLTATKINVFLGMTFVLWVQIHIFTKKKTTAYDMICKTNFINGKTSSKTPW